MDVCILHIGSQTQNMDSPHPPAYTRFESRLSAHLPIANWYVFSVLDDPLPDISRFDGYLITGGKYSVFEPSLWQNRLFSWIRVAAEKQVPIVGVCYGHQAIAFALGGTVERSRKGWGVGLMSIRLIHQANWMRPSNIKDFNLHAMHQDQVIQMHNRVNVFLSSEFCPISGYQIDENILGIQQHPDFYPSLSRYLIEKRAEKIGVRSQVALDTLTNRDDSPVALQWIADFLLHSISKKS